jgi:hypothetical protein
VQDVAFVEPKSGFFAGDVRVNVGVVVETGFHANFAFSLAQLAVSEFERDDAIRVLLFESLEIRLVD